MTKMIGLTLAASVAILAIWAYTSRSVQPIFSAAGDGPRGYLLATDADGADR